VRDVVTRIKIWSVLMMIGENMIYLVRSVDCCEPNEVTSVTMWSVPNNAWFVRYMFTSVTMCSVRNDDWCKHDVFRT